MSQIDRVLREVADEIEQRLTPVCVCEHHGGHDVAHAVKRAAEIVRVRADQMILERAEQNRPPV